MLYSRSMFQKHIKKVMDGSIKLTRDLVLPSIALFSIVHAIQSNTPLPPGMEIIAGGIAVESLGNLLSKFDDDDNVSNDDIASIIEDNIMETGLKDFCKLPDFAEKFEQLNTKLDVMGTVLQIHENNIVERILMAVSYYPAFGKQLLVELENHHSLIKELAPKKQYALSVIANIEGLVGQIDYVRLSGQMTYLKSETAFFSNPHRKFYDPSFSILISHSKKIPDDNTNAIEYLKSVQPTSTFSDIRDVIKTTSKFVLIGEPGSGKTTTLRRLELEIAWNFINGSSPILPLYLRLPAWGNETFDEFIKQGWKLPEEIITGLANGKIWLLLDGLNELGDDSSVKIDQIRSFLSGINQPQKVIISCRKNDYLDALRLDLTTVELEPLDSKQIYQFVRNYVKDEAIADKFLVKVLDQKDYYGYEPPKRHLYHLARNPYMLVGLLLIYQNSPNLELPSNTGILFKGLVEALWKREHDRNTPGWVQFSNVVVPLSELAFAMIEQDKSTIVSKDFAQQFIQNHELLHVAHRANIIEINGTKIRFYHQLIQEYFAALALDEDIILSKPNYYYDGEIGGKIGDKWDNVIIAKSGIIENADSLVENIFNQNPFLAGQCIVSGAKVSDVLFNQIVASVTQHLSDKSVKGEAMRALLIKIGNPCIPFILEKCEVKDWEFRWNAIEIITSMGISTISHLHEQVNHPHYYVRWVAVFALGQLYLRTHQMKILNMVISFEHDEFMLIRDVVAYIRRR